MAPLNIFTTPGSPRSRGSCRCPCNKAGWRSSVVPVVVRNTPGGTGATNRQTQTNKRTELLTCHRNAYTHPPASIHHYSNLCRLRQHVQDKLIRHECNSRTRCHPYCIRDTTLEKSVDSLIPPYLFCAIYHSRILSFGDNDFPRCLGHFYGL